MWGCRFCSLLNYPYNLRCQACFNSKYDFIPTDWTQIRSLIRYKDMMVIIKEVILINDGIYAVVHSIDYSIDYSKTHASLHRYIPNASNWQHIEQFSITKPRNEYSDKINYHMDYNQNKLYALHCESGYQPYDLLSIYDTKQQTMKTIKLYTHDSPDTQSILMIYTKCQNCKIKQVSTDANISITTMIITNWCRLVEFPFIPEDIISAINGLTSQHQLYIIAKGGKYGKIPYTFRFRVDTLDFKLLDCTEGYITIDEYLKSCYPSLITRNGMNGNEESFIYNKHELSNPSLTCGVAFKKCIKQTIYGFDYMCKIQLLYIDLCLFDKAKEQFIIL
eukprot:67695_1